MEWEQVNESAYRPEGIWKLYGKIPAHQSKIKAITQHAWWPSWLMPITVVISTNQPFQEKNWVLVADQHCVDNSPKSNSEHNSVIKIPSQPKGFSFIPGGVLYVAQVLPEFQFIFFYFHFPSSDGGTNEM